MSEQETWPAPNIWGAMPSAENADYGVDSYHIHRWIRPRTDEEFEQIFFVFAEKEEVEAAADYLNALEVELTLLRKYKALADEMAPVVQKILMFGQTIYQADFQRDWLARYDALQEGQA